MYNLPFVIIYLLGASALSFLLLNNIRKIIITYQLFGPAKQRDLHLKPVPSFLGFGFFFLFILGTFFYSKLFDPFINYPSLAFSLLVLSLVGIWDDLNPMRSYQKLLCQLMAIGALLTLNQNLVVVDLYGFLGIRSIPYFVGFLFTSFIGVVMINSFNLIDGIDGNAAFASLLGFTLFALFFFGVDNEVMFGLCILLVGMNIGYLPINFSKTKKGFMGDTGAMFMGFMLFFMTLLTVNSNSVLLGNLIESKSIIPLMPLTVFSLPIIDTLSIYIYRLSIGKSPFSPDNFHLHHLALRYFNTNHMISALGLNFFTLVFAVVMSYFSFNHKPIVSITVYFAIIFCVITYSIWIRKKVRIKLGNRKGNVILLD